MTVTPDCPTLLRRTTPVTVPGTVVQSKFAVAVTLDWPVPVCDGVGQTVPAGGVTATVYAPGWTFGIVYEPPATVIAVPIVVVPCVMVTVTPARPTPSTRTVPVTLPGALVQSKSAVVMRLD